MLNLGVEGMMIVGAATGFAAAYLTDSTAVGAPDVTGDEYFAGCEVVVKGRFINQRVAPCPLEVRTSAVAIRPVDLPEERRDEVVARLSALLKVTVADNTKIKVEGIDRQLVGQVAADIRGYYPPEPYKGKGVRYAGEKIHRKEGKTVQ